MGSLYGSPFTFMTTADLITLFNNTTRGDLLTDSDQETDATGASQVLMLNEALKEFSAWIQFSKPDYLITLGGNTQYQTALTALGTRKVKTVYKMLDIANNRIYEPVQLNELDRYYPQWRTDTANGNPVMVCQTQSSLIVYPVPASTTTYYLDCLCDPLPLSTSTPNVAPEIDDSLHRHLARYAAFLACNVNQLTPGQKQICDTIVMDAQRACYNFNTTSSIQL